MNRVVVIDAVRRKSPVDLWRWAIIGLAATVLCSCASLPDARQPISGQHVAGRQRVEGQPASRSLAPVVVPDPVHGQNTQLAGGQSFLVEDCQVERLVNEPEAPLACTLPEAPLVCTLPEGPQVFPRDEYLCDGGDGNYRGSVDAIDGEGIEPSDTIAQFDSELSRGHVVASNRVCIYAPRFAATRKVTRLRQDAAFSRAGGLHDTAQIKAEATPTAPNDVIQDLATEREVAETIKHELQDADRGLLLDDVDVLAETGRRELPFESRGAATGKQLDAIERVLTEQQDVDAIQWTDIQAVELAIDGRPAHAVSDVGPPSDVYIFEVNRQPRLCLKKTLSSPAAQPGEVVLVTIHYQNVGDSAIENLRIVDNLTTRLEFVPDSNVSSHRALFSTRDNSVGSAKLLWEIRETIQPGQHGEVQFRCRIR